MEDWKLQADLARREHEKSRARREQALSTILNTVEDKIKNPPCQPWAGMEGLQVLNEGKSCRAPAEPVQTLAQPARAQSPQPQERPLKRRCTVPISSQASQDGFSGVGSFDSQVLGKEVESLLLSTSGSFSSQVWTQDEQPARGSTEVKKNPSEKEERFCFGKWLASARQTSSSEALEVALPSESPGFQSPPRLDPELQQEPSVPEDVALPSESSGSQSPPRLDPELQQEPLVQEEVALPSESPGSQSPPRLVPELQQEQPASPSSLEPRGQPLTTDRQWTSSS